MSKRNRWGELRFAPAGHTKRERTMDVTLTVGERLTLLMVLPSEGDLTTIRVVHQLRQELSFTEDELTTLDFQTDTGDDGTMRTRWNAEADEGREFTLGAKAHEQIVKALTKMSSEGKLRAEHLSVCDKFGLE